MLDRLEQSPVFGFGGVLVVQRVVIVPFSDVPRLNGFHLWGNATVGVSRVFNYFFAPFSPYFVKVDHQDFNFMHLHLSLLYGRSNRAINTDAAFGVAGYLCR